MKSPTQPLALIGAVMALAFPVLGATLSSETPLHLKADATSPVIATLEAGTSVQALTPEELKNEMLENLPGGWVAIRFEGPVYGFAPNSAVGKNLFLRPGTIVRTEPSPTATMITMVGEKDSAELVEVVGDWSKVVFTKSLVGFINPAATRVASQPDAGVPAQAATDSESAIAPQPPPSGAGSQSAAQPTQFIDATPRVFQGYLMRTRRVLGVGPKLDYQLVDEGGRRIALLDLSALLITEPLERYENRQVSVFGPVSRLQDVKDMIIRVETLRLSQ